jgi:hypothetical protein
VIERSTLNVAGEHLCACAVCLLLTAWTVTPSAASETKNPVPSVPAVVFAAPPEIDGHLDDPCWQQATHIEDFRREKVDAPPLEPTEAWIGCDSTAIYVAFRCGDSKPEQIRRTQKKRQGRIWDDDRVEVGIDVGNNGSNWYSFNVTPAGTQYDSVPGGTSEKIEWKGDWRAAALEDESGWTAEIEIPFSILRSPDGQDTFRIYLSRILARESNDWCTWPPAFARVWDTDNCARWTALNTPPVPFRCTLMPYALTVYSGDEEDREALTAGADVRGTLPNGVVGLFTYNPDFRDIEDVVETIDFTFVERYLPEYRPFFQEGQWYFPGGIFYSRRIEDFDYGAKAFGSLGRQRFGVLDAYRRGGENHFVWNYRYEPTSTSNVTLGGVSRRVPDEPDNDAYEFSGYWGRPFDGGNRQWYASRSWSQTAGEGGDGSRISLGTGLWQLQGLGWNVGYSAVGSDFLDEDGYVPETGVRNFNTQLSWRRSYDEGALLSRDWVIDLDRGASEDGSRRNLWTEYNWHLRNGQYWNPGITRGERDGLGVASNYIWHVWNEKDMYHRGWIGANHGKRYGEPYRYREVGQAFHPAEKWCGELGYERVYAASLDDDGNLEPAELTRQLVFTATCDVSDERTVSARLVRSAGNTNAYAAYRQRVRKGMDLLVVLGDPNADQWVSRLAVKAIWCL